ncbi:MAG: hypothetical protein AAF942_16885, partial [Pseudomonadota bacterium]
CEFASTDGAWFPSADRVGFYALAILAGLVGCYAATRLLGVTEKMSTIVIMILAGAFWLLPVFGPFFAIADVTVLAPDSAAGAIAGVTLVLWFLGIAVRAIHLVTDGGIIRPAIAASILVVFIALPKLVLTPPATWLAQPAKLPLTWTQENLYYGQFGMMERALQWIGKGRPEATDLYFVGFGADAREPVFVNEMRNALQLFEQQYGARDRSMIMINSRATVRQAPLANIHNLGRTLSEVGKRMDKDQDILFLYISAPRLIDMELDPQFEPLDFVRIHPANIRRMLQDAGIKYWVAVLSACDSDGFIEHLRGANSLVIAPPPRERHTRDCKGDSAFTEFGKAVFDDALRGATSMPAAFENVVKVLGPQSGNDAQAGDQPVLYVGSGIVPKLREFETQRKVDAATATKPPTVKIPDAGAPAPSGG